MICAPLCPIHPARCYADKPPAMGIMLILAFQAIVWFAVGFLARPILEAWWHRLIGG